MISKVAKKHFPEQFLTDPEWPEAVPEYMVCKNEDQKLSRALIISEWAGNEGPILDFGCGDGKVVEILNNQSINAVGYETNQDWSEIKNKYFKTVILHDVVDHILDDRVKILNKIRNILIPEGRVKVRCHPWCSRHGGHHILTANKAYAHLVYPEKWPTEKNIDPILTYENIFKFSGFKLIDKTVYRRPIEDWILRKFALNLFSFWPKRMWFDQDCPSILPYLELEYIDYELSVN